MAILLTAFLVVAAQSPGQKDNDVYTLVGVWTCTSAINDGKPLAADTVAKLRLTMTEDHYKTELGDQALFDSTYRLDAVRQPKQIDIIGTEGEHQGKAALGIYAIEGDMLQLCYTMPGGSRPTDFESRTGSGATMTIWTRNRN